MTHDRDERTCFGLMKHDTWSFHLVKGGGWRSTEFFINLVGGSWLSISEALEQGVGGCLSELSVSLYHQLFQRMISVLFLSKHR